MGRSYWNGKVALICSYCREYHSFPSVEELKEHIKKEHTTEVNASPLNKTELRR